MLLIYLAIVLPLRIGFELDAKGFLYYFEYAIDMLFVFDICVNFRTGYTNSFGAEEMNPYGTAKNYVAGEPYGSLYTYDPRPTSHRCAHFRKTINLRLVLARPCLRATVRLYERHGHVR